MSNYTKSTNFATKDNLTPGDPLKVVRGTEIDTEFNNIATAVATKTDNASAAITGGSITGITDLAVADGGTGASTAAGGLNNLLPSQTSNANKYLQTDGTNASWDAVSLSTADITGTLAVANGGTGVTTSTGTTNVVLSNSPTLVTPALGTPSSAVLTNATGLPISTGVSGLGTGVATLLATPSSANLASAITDETGSGSLVFATSPTLVTPILGTPTSGTLTNATGLPISTGVSGLGTGVATFLATPSSANLLAAVTDETGTGSLVFATSPTLVTPALGTPASGVVTNLTGTASININGTVGATTPNTGAFTTLSASTSITNSGLTTGRVVYTTTGGLETSSANLLYSGTDLTVYGLTVGRGAGSVATNTAVGASALAANTSGDQNAAFGTNALSSNTTGAGNNAFGRNALTTNTTGSANTALGFKALESNTTASNNTAVGYQSLYANTTGATNVAVGDSALITNTTGSDNVAVGRRAGQLNLTGGQNTSLGTQALAINSSGSSNTAIGNQALQNTTVSNNTAVGYQAGYTNTTGSYNTLVGYAAGYSISGTGNTLNTFIGQSAGYNVTTGTKNTIIGTYNGNQDSLNISTLSNYAVISDGDGNRQITMKEGQTLALDSAVPNAGTGITFPATQSASSDANTLDDYEEGTWTPTDGSGAGLSLTILSASYIKIGQMVYCSAAITYPTTASASNANIAGLPFTCTATGSTGYWGGSSVRYSTYGSATLVSINGSATNADIWDFSGVRITNLNLSTKRNDWVFMYRASA